MNLVALMPVRNEDWVLGVSARAALSWCDKLAILDHRSNDSSLRIMAELRDEFPGRVQSLRVDDDGWYEMDHRQLLLQQVRQMSASHVAIVDADEILTGNLLESIRAHVERLPHGHMLELPGYNLRGGLNQYHESGIWGKRWFSVVFADDARLYWGGDQFHHREPFGMLLKRWRPVAQKDGGVMHLWGASERRLKAKHALYKITERLRWPEKPIGEIERTYNQAFYPSANKSFDQDWTYTAVPESWWAPYQQWMSRMDVDGEPWQEAECRRLYEENPGRFEGLNLFGVAEKAAA